MGDHAEDEIHKEMFGCYPWEEDFEEIFRKPVNAQRDREPSVYLGRIGVTNKKRVYQAFERYVLEKPPGKTRKTFKMVNVARIKFDLFKEFVDLNKEVFVKNLKFNNLKMPRGDK